MTRWVLSASLIFVAAAQDDSLDPLGRAAENGDLTQVNTLLARGADPNARDQQGETPLMKAASAHRRSVPDTGKTMARDYPATAKLLLDRGADVNARDAMGRTALLAATEGSASEYRVIGANEPWRDC